MSLNQLHRKNITSLYCMVFYALMLFKWWNGLFLYQLKPIIFDTRFDMVTWALMETGLHQFIIQHPFSWYLMDILFYCMPVVYWLVYLKNKRLAPIAAVVMLVTNWVYIQVYTLYPASSIESFMAWLLFPIAFIPSRLRTFYYIIQCLRYFFLYLLISAGLWKIVQAGIFNPDQMSGVLLYQHKEFLASSPGYWLSRFFYWLINHSRVSYLLYLAGTLLELCFIAGFFTKKFDRWLIYAFVTFLLFDLFIMRIYYWELIPFVIVLLYSRYKRPSALR